MSRVEKSELVEEKLRCQESAKELQCPFYDDARDTYTQIYDGDHQMNVARNCSHLSGLRHLAERGLTVEGLLNDLAESRENIEQIRMALKTGEGPHDPSYEVALVLAIWKAAEKVYVKFQQAEEQVQVLRDLLIESKAYTHRGWSVDGWQEHDLPARIDKALIATKSKQ